MFCSNCGEQIVDNSKFCSKCGQAVNESVQSKVKEEQPTPQMQ